MSIASNSHFGGHVYLTNAFCSSWIFRKRCLEYKANNETQKQWQWFDLPYSSVAIKEYLVPRLMFWVPSLRVIRRFRNGCSHTIASVVIIINVEREASWKQKSKWSSEAFIKLLRTLNEILSLSLRIHHSSCCRCLQIRQLQPTRTSLFKQCGDDFTRRGFNSSEGRARIGKYRNRLNYFEWWQNLLAINYDHQNEKLYNKQC